MKNDRGVPIMETYSEWKDGPYSKQGIQCQNCHMPLRYDVNVVDPNIMKPKHSATAHEFQGGHSQINLKKAAKLDIYVQREGDQALISAYVTNAESGHKIPTGTPARKIILKVVVTDPDGDILAEMSRVYRKVLVDESGLILENNADQILYAARVYSDNRIEPKETRREDFVFDIPSGVEAIHVNGDLHYEFITPLMMTTGMIVNMASSDAVLFAVSSTTFGVETKWWIVILPVALILVAAIAWLVRKKKKVNAGSSDR